MSSMIQCDGTHQRWRSMNIATVTQIIDQVKQLPQAQRRELLDQLVELVGSIEDEPRTRITDLEGLGAEIWQGRDAQDYVNQERDSSDG
jgi:hypothetical protein